MNVFLGPPTIQCLHCASPLQANHQPTTAICFTLSGPLPAQKIILRCKNCDINYRYETYGGGVIGGYRYYDTCREYIAASNAIYIEKDICEQWIAAA